MPYESLNNYETLSVIDVKRKDVEPLIIATLQHLGQKKGCFRLPRRKSSQIDKYTQAIDAIKDNDNFLPAMILIDNQRINLIECVNQDISKIPQELHFNSQTRTKIRKSNHRNQILFYDCLWKLLLKVGKETEINNIYQIDTSEFNFDARRSKVSDLIHAGSFEILYSIPHNPINQLQQSHKFIATGFSRWD